MPNISKFNIENKTYDIKDAIAREWEGASPINVTTGATPHTVKDIMDKIAEGLYPSYYLLLDNIYYIYDVTGYDVRNSSYTIYYSPRHLNDYQSTAYDIHTATLRFPLDELSFTSASNTSTFIIDITGLTYQTLVLNGVEPSWRMGTTYTNVQRFDLYGEFYPYSDSSHPRGIATVSKGTWIQDSGFANITSLSLCFITENNPRSRLYVLVPKSLNLTTVNAFRDWLANENITVQYKIEV